MLEFPTTILLDTTNLCNARCPFCPLFAGDHQFDRARRPAAIMDQALYEDILAEIAGWSRRLDIVTSTNGEILQDPKFAERMDVIRGLGVGRYTTLLTNGHFLSEQAGEAILDANVLKMIIGFDGASKEVYEAHRVRCDYERVLDNIRRFVATRRRRGGTTWVEIKFVRTTKNVHEVAAAHELFRTIMDPELDFFHDCLAHDWSDGDLASTGLYYLDKYPKGARRRSCHYFDTGTANSAGRHRRGLLLGLQSDHIVGGSWQHPQCGIGRLAQPATRRICPRSAGQRHDAGEMRKLHHSPRNADTRFVLGPDRPKHVGISRPEQFALSDRRSPADCA